MLAFLLLALFFHYAREADGQFLKVSPCFCPSGRLVGATCPTPVEAPPPPNSLESQVNHLRCQSGCLMDEELNFLRDFAVDEEEIWTSFNPSSLGSSEVQKLEVCRRNCLIYSVFKTLLNQNLTEAQCQVICATTPQPLACLRGCSIGSRIFEHETADNPDLIPVQPTQTPPIFFDPQSPSPWEFSLNLSEVTPTSQMRPNSTRPVIHGFILQIIVEQNGTNITDNHYMTHPTVSGSISLSTFLSTFRCHVMYLSFGVVNFYGRTNLTEFTRICVPASLLEPAAFGISVGSSAETDPATVIFYWSLMDSVSSADQNVTYTVTVTCMNDMVVASQSVAYPDSSLKIPGLPACTTCTFLRATLAAERNNESSNCNLKLAFSTFESSALITVTVSNVDSTANYLPGSDISLQCSWNTPVYYVAWYKDGMLIYEEDLAASSVLMAPPPGISVESGYTTMVSTLNIASAALDDSGNYTCAVTCGAKGVEFGMIAGNLQDTTEVFVSAVNCGDPGTPTRGRRTLSSTYYNSVVGYSCDVAYRLQGPSRRTCQSNGQWSGSLPQCNLVDCGDPGTPTNGQRTLSGTTYNAGVFYTCNEGYTLQGQQIRICRSTGLWSERLPVCTGAAGDTMKVTGHLMWLAVLAGVLKEQFLF